MVDAADLKSALREEVWVRVPPSAGIKNMVVPLMTPNFQFSQVVFKGVQA